MSSASLEQFKNFVLQQPEAVLQAGVLTQHLSPPMIATVIQVLQAQLPPADVILAAPSDHPVLIFALSQALGIPFVSAQLLDIVETDDADSSGFLQDNLLLQVQVSGKTLAIARGALPKKARVLIFRDVLSQGIMTLGLLHLIEYSQASAVGVAALIEKSYLGGRSRIAVAASGIQIEALLCLAQVDGRVVLEKRGLDLHK